MTVDIGIMILIHMKKNRLELFYVVDIFITKIAKIFQI